jgi:hypothetical protein
MNKLFTILCTLVFITACGGPSWDGQWSGVGDVVDATLEISDGSISVMENESVYDTCTFDAGESETTLDCEKEDDKLTISLDGDVITLSFDDDDEVFTFKRD